MPPRKCLKIRVLSQEIRLLKKKSRIMREKDTVMNQTNKGPLGTDFVTDRAGLHILILMGRKRAGMIARVCFYLAKQPIKTAEGGSLEPPSRRPAAETQLLCKRLIPARL